MKKQVKELIVNELIISKSKFISFLFPVFSLEETKEKINEYKNKYKDATHVCYSYILDENTFKYYDDGEPSSTAGAPIYQVLKNNDLIYSMCVVVRYFGGTKLGVGGLVKAYTNSCLEALNKATITDYIKQEEFSFGCSYSLFEQIEYFLKNNNIEILNKDFSDNVKIKVLVSEEKKELLINKFSNSLTY